MQCATYGVWLPIVTCLFVSICIFKVIAISLFTCKQNLHLQSI